MKTRDEIKESNVKCFSEIIKNILFDNDDEIKDFLKWTKPELLEFYKDWKHYDESDDLLTMRSPKHHMRKIVGGIIRNMIHQLMFNDGDLSQKDMLDYITIKRREKIIDELIN